MKKILKKADGTRSEIKIKTKPITIYQLLDLYGFNLLISFEIDGKWKAKIYSLSVTKTLNGFVGIGDTQLQSLQDLMSKLKGKTVDGWYFPSTMSLGHKGWVNRKNGVEEAA